jgi:Domain of unknown function (DUF6916)
LSPGDFLEQATSATFEPHVGERFAVAPQQGEPFDAVLSSCAEAPYGSHAEARRAPFSLVFHADPDPGMPQQTCEITHEELGGFELFLVPVGPDERGMRYQAVIS